ncbi:MAG: TonB-dependent receptor plug domain-containing protein [Bacteroidia bacterium]|nr:TonB-dependent receptor plug domain-containing protein [Bacteroidia bacterium]
MKRLLLFTRILLLYALIFWLTEPLPAQNLAHSKVSTTIPNSRQEEQKSLKSILTELGTQHQVNFIYYDKYLAQKYITLSKIPADKSNLEQTLTRLLTPFGLKFEKLDERVYTITEAKESIRKIEKNKIRFDNNPPGKTMPATRSLKRVKLDSAPPGIPVRAISGTITGTDGEPLPGVNIIVKGTSIGTISDNQGKYTLGVPEDKNVLTFSFVGYNTQEIEIGNQSVIDITLEEDVEQMEEVVVIGYGTQEKRDVTGAISSISGKTLQEIPTASFDQAIVGRAAGVQVLSNSGEPGGAASIRIRGVGTVNSNEPLYVVDGIPINNAINGNQSALNTLNPGDIESIEILKDASALAIYGARAQNGVVMITTKRGKSGTLNVTLDSWASLSVLKPKY